MIDNNLNDFSYISVVIQGPVNSYQERKQEEGVTKKCIESIRRYLPGSKVILSTWEGQNCEGLEPDILLLNKDPGGNIVAYDEDGNSKKLNFNRQIVSTLEGLKIVKTPYVVKIRSDNFLTDNKFVFEQKKYSHRNSNDSVFDERIVINTSYFRLYADGQEVIMHPSDFFHYGRTVDVIKIWDIPLFDDLVYDLDKKGLYQDNWSPYKSLHAEQVYCERWLSQLDGNAPKLTDRYDNSYKNKKYWLRFIASNFIILEPEQIGLGLVKRFKKKIKRPNEFSYFDWLMLYKKYCDVNIKVPYAKFLLFVGIHRWIKIKIKRVI
ncbi:WavE lipopolysaccharide synthesis family protein [Photobacterium leiognathi]|uniref:WavE lipopolysaccharide synthesis family protein n=1 Tax=Photobacterium leiognathi TaxID=553611 RepID=UPI0029825585|nr:WavE lipopolysaccharide synthesis family protein [Photobacterium leiognathi]